MRSGFRVSGFGFRVSGFGFLRRGWRDKLPVAGYWSAYTSFCFLRDFRVSGFGFRILRSGIRGSGPDLEWEVRKIPDEDGVDALERPVRRGCAGSPQNPPSVASGMSVGGGP